MNTEDVKKILEELLDMISHIENEECFSFSIEYVPNSCLSAFEMKEVETKNESSNEIAE